MKLSLSNSLPTASAYNAKSLTNNFEKMQCLVVVIFVSVIVVYFAWVWGPWDGLPLIVTDFEKLMAYFQVWSAFYSFKFHYTYVHKPRDNANISDELRSYRATCAMNRLLYPNPTGDCWLVCLFLRKIAHFNN